jgi:hypothetical protein
MTGVRLSLLAWLTTTVVLAAAEPSSPKLDPIALLRTHCTACHNADHAEAELDLARIAEKPARLHDDFALLGRIVEAVETEAMPPVDAERPLPPGERERLVAWLKEQLAVVARRTNGDPGPVPLQRLTKSEYRHVLRDLTGGVVVEAGQFLPSEGGAGEGFANVGEAQGMTPAIVEQYVTAAKLALRHLRAYPNDGLVWNAVPREPIDEPAAARKDLVDEMIAWYVGQQQQWGAEHRDALAEHFGNAHVPYLEAAWRYRYRAALGRESANLSEFATCDDVRLAPVALEKWWDILNDAEDKASPLADWAVAWRALPGPDKLDAARLRKACLAIIVGRDGDLAGGQNEDYAPPYEISFHEAKEEVLAAATDEGRWPFRIDVSRAKELFLVVTDAGDGGNGEYAVWRRGRIIFRDGTSRPWQEVVEVVGVNSSRKFNWGVDGEGSAKLGPDCIGVRPPGALKFAVPQGAIVFEVDLTLDENRTKQASIQSLVLKEKPISQSYIPGRYVFGGRKRADKPQATNKERDRLLRLRNVSEANHTKIGLNAERNVFADWTRTPLAHLGGPWPDHEADKAEPRAPYHYTVEQVRRNAATDDLARLRNLEDRLVAVAQSPEQEIVALLRVAGLHDAKEGLAPVNDFVAKLDADVRQRLARRQRDAAKAETAAASTARRVLADFARRAWRRPLTEAEVELLVNLYRRERAQGVSFDGAVKTPLSLVLASPYFLYRGAISEPASVAATTTNAAVVPLGSYELASRLSFFLWASLPDDELLTLAAADRLRNAAELREQVARMLRDPRAAALATDFAGQVWGFTDFASFTGPDSERFPEFTPALRLSMQAEVETFLTDLIRNDRPLTALIDADYTFADSRLAEHYGLPDRPGLTMHRVSVPAERGGLPAMGLFLTKTSLPLRTSPVQRGVWIVEQLLGRRIPPPPPNAGKISDDERSPDGLSIREQLRIHRSQATCAACHARIDAFGVALENFDPIGRRRTTLRDGEPLVNVETTRDGATLDGFAGLRQYLVKHRDEVLAHINRKLVGYALGRAVLPGDTELLERLNAGLPRHEHRFSFLVEAIVTSPQFLNRRIAAPAATASE